MKVIVKNLKVTSKDWDNLDLIRLILTVINEVDPYKPTKVPAVIKRSLEELYPTKMPTDLMLSAAEIYELLNSLDDLGSGYSRSMILNKAEPYTLHKIFHSWDFKSQTSLRSDYIILFERMNTAKLRGVEIELDLSMALRYLQPIVTQYIKDHKS